MERAPADSPTGDAGALERLAGSAGRGATETLGRVAEALRVAGDVPGGETAAFDRAIVSAVLESPRSGPVLSELDLGQLAALADRVAGRLASPDAAGESRRLAWDLLDLIRRPSLLRRIAFGDVAAWSERTLTLIERSAFTVGPLFRQRAEAYGPKALFEVPTARGIQTLTWRHAAARVELLARGLTGLDPEDGPGRVALLSENRIEMALVDLACLTGGIVNVLIPANSTDADVAYMLRHAAVRTVVVSTREQLAKVSKHRDSLPELRSIVVIEPPSPVPAGVLTLEDLASLAQAVPAQRIRERSEAVGSGDLATVMYTSGTTGMPKGIRFSHGNIVFKRFARALALPELGEDDVFLCYLPLYHTFGRFLEMLGCVFWGSLYCFLENPSVEALVNGMRRHRPTTFISVPKKWMQLYEAIAARADPLEASDEELLEATRQVTGGRLRWGLSAAGHLDSEIFRFFQHNGVELMSGFGMTEATGGITMTPPGRYKDDSLGCALPGIELSIADDGELLVRGPYVMLGYLDPPDGQPSFDEQGWLPTGDLMEVDADGFLRLIDRKKEIYKNIKGETIAPQRIENLFRDFESVRRVFLVGDHRPYNTVLIHPNYDYRELDLRALPAEELRDHLRSIVVSVNKFLSPYERIVDFAVIDRDLDPEQGELTAKGTPRRSTVERNFRDTIRLLYRRASFPVGGLELIVPNWLFQALGLTAQDLVVRDDAIAIRSGAGSLTVRRAGRGRVVVGSCSYRHERGPLNLGGLLGAPRLWLGNEELADFVALDLPALQRPGSSAGLEWQGRPAPFNPTEAQRAAFEACAGKAEFGLDDLHLAAMFLAAARREDALRALGLLDEVLASEDAELAEPVRLLVARAALAGSIQVRRRAFQVLAAAERDSRFEDTLARFLAAPGKLLDRRTRAELVGQDLSDAKVEALIAAAQAALREPAPSSRGILRAVSLMRLLAEYGMVHPARYRRLRALLLRAKLFAPVERVRREAARAADALIRGFRKWLGPSSRIAVDAETGREYRWSDVVVFDEDVPAGDRRRLLAALRGTGLLREAVFLFSGGATIRLNDIPVGGVWVRLLGSRHGKSVYRLAVQTRYQGSFDLAVNVNHELTREQIDEETHWLILCGDAQDRDPLVEDFGGYWPDHDLWSEEFIPGETLERAMQRLSRRETEAERLRFLWPFFVWTTLTAYVDFWNRTGRRWEIADASLSNVVVPTHDYHSGARLVSLSSRRPFRGIVPMLLGFRDDLLAPAEERFPQLGGLVPWSVVLSSLPEVVGEQEGLALLRETLDGPDELPLALRAQTEAFVAEIEARGFRPMRLHFAASRYRRWEQLGGESTPQARASTLLEIYETYGLPRLVPAHPEVRVRYFLETVFHDSPAPLVQGLGELVDRLRRRELSVESLIDAVADLRSRVEVGADDDSFLARLSHPYLRPEDAAEFELSDRGDSEVVVQFEDQEGSVFRVRHAMNPKEVGRLHRQFLAAKLDVRFRPEHQYLVALNERNHIIGGIYYHVEEDGQAAHLEKIVVAERYRKKGIAEGLMNEFFNRLRAAGVKAVTTGFFRPAFFYSYGFKIEKRYAGLVKSLEQEGPPPAPVNPALPPA